MAYHRLFETTPEQIATLDDEGLRLLIARLCEAELRRRGLSTTAVLYGGNQNAADGGIDVLVDLPAGTEMSGPIPRPDTGFQAKAQDMPSSKIANEMRPERKQSDGNPAPAPRKLARQARASEPSGPPYSRFLLEQRKLPPAHVVRAPLELPA